MTNQLVSSSSLPPSWRYDVFLSFRGEDTGTNFADHLYQALRREISPTLLQAIEESRISLIILSEKYPNDLRWIELGEQSNIHRRHTVVFNLPSNYHPRHLVRFDVVCGYHIPLAKLTSTNLSGCEFLKKIPDFFGSPNIKHLDLSECKSLVDVDDSVGFLGKLLTRFATRLGSRSLRLCLKGCTRLESFPEIEEDKMKSLWYLEMQKSGIRELPSSIAYLIGLRRLKVNGCENLRNIYIYILDYLDLNGCNLSESDFLVPLDCCFVSLPDCISKFVNLWELKLSGCKRLGEIGFLSQMVSEIDPLHQDEKIPKFPLTLECLNLCNCFRLSGDEVAKLENNLLSNQQRSRLEILLQCSEVLIILPSNEVPKWFSYTSNHPTRHLLEYGCEEAFVGGSEFYFEIPLNLQGETLLGLALSVVLEAPTYAPHYTYISSPQRRKHQKLRATSSLGKKPRPHGSLDIVNDEYDQQQWLSLSSEPADGHPKRRQIDLNVPIDIEEEVQELPSTSDNQQSLTY
ncbi:unnamed protein product [Malus baccata var. baccata]